MLFASATTWAAVQPIRSIHSQNEAAERFAKGDLSGAEKAARESADYNPLAVEPLWKLASVQNAQGDSQATAITLERATKLQPANPETWRQLGNFQLAILGNPAKAIKAYQVALYLDPTNVRSKANYVAARQALQEKSKSPHSR
jgi:tetratricopeptide (TPR) repeat protein